tara:strand:- start:6702 stop:6875 length:174 start_codon:yes stop_codon:yes gene_type:complete
LNQNGTGKKLKFEHAMLVALIASVSFLALSHLSAELGLTLGDLFAEEDRGPDVTSVS